MNGDEVFINFQLVNFDKKKCEILHVFCTENNILCENLYYENFMNKNKNEILKDKLNYLKLYLKKA